MPYVMEDVITTRMIGLSSASLGYIEDVKLEPRILLVLSEYVRGCQGAHTQIGKVYTVCHTNFVDIVSFVICNKQI
jgi:hypothetical protein